MHRTKKLAVTATAAALLMTAGVSSAMATSSNANNGHAGKITICHRTGSDKNPYVKITISENARAAHENHPKINGRGDIFDLQPGQSCPTGTPTPPGGGGDDNGGECIASSGSGDSTQTQHGLVNVGNVNLGLDNLLGNAFCQSNLLNNPTVAVLGNAVGGFVGDSGDGDCVAESTSGDSTQEQDGVVNVGNINVGADNLLANAFCQSNVLNNVTASVLGDAIGGVVGSDSDSGDGDCIAESLPGGASQDQDGAINVGNVNVGADNVLANAFCGSDVLNNATVALLGSSFDGSSLGTGLLAGGPAGLLSGDASWLLSGLTTDVNVLANVLVQF